MTILLWQTYYDNSIIFIYEILLWSCVVRVRICTVSANTCDFDPVLWDRAGCLAPALCPWGVLATGCVHDTPPLMHDARCTISDARCSDARMLGCSFWCRLRIHSCSNVASKILMQIEDSLMFKCHQQSHTRMACVCVYVVKVLSVLLV